MYEQIYTYIPIYISMRCITYMCIHLFLLFSLLLSLSFLLSPPLFMNPKHIIKKRSVRLWYRLDIYVNRVYVLFILAQATETRMKTLIINFFDDGDNL